MQLGHTLTAIARRVPFYKGVRHKYEIDRLRRLIASATPLNVVIGGGETSYEGWIFTDRDLLDIMSRASGLSCSSLKVSTAFFASMCSSTSRKPIVRLDSLLMILFKRILRTA